MSVEALMLDAGMDMEKMTPFEAKCYGMPEAEIRREYMDSFTAKHSGLEMVVMSVLSDCQEMLQGLSTQDERDEQLQDTLRQQMNVAKFILSEMMDAKRG